MFIVFFELVLSWYTAVYKNAIKLQSPKIILPETATLINEQFC